MPELLCQVYHCYASGMPCFVQPRFQNLRRVTPTRVADV